MLHAVLALLWAVAWPVHPPGQPLRERFPPPAGFQRVETAPGSFGKWLLDLPLLPDGAQVHLFNGELKNRQTVHAAVVDIDVGARDLQQCADAVMRLRAEWLWAQKRSNDACFVAASGKKLRFGGGDYRAYRRWLDTVFTWANTGSLKSQLQPVDDETQVQPGDVWIVGPQGRMPVGHAVLVLDVVRNAQGHTWMLLAQSYMPAQQVHVLKNVTAPSLGAWFPATAHGGLQSPEWPFPPGSLRRFSAKGECGR